MVQQILAADLSRELQKGAAIYLVDVRLPWEHEIAALPGSTLVPLQELAERLEEVQPPKGALVVVYCHHGVRSLRAAAFLEQNGMDNVCSLAGGIDAWSQEIDPSLRRY